MSKEAMKLALDALEVATTPLANDRQEVLRAQAALREALAEHPAQGCEYCNHPLYAGTKCKNCGRVTEQAAIKRDLTPEQPAQQQKEGFASPGGGYVPAIPRPIPLDWKLVPRKATPKMLRAMDECAQEGYDERLYEGMASSVYMAAWDASPVLGTLPPSEKERSMMDIIVGNLVREGINKHRARELAEHFIKHTSPPKSKPWVGLTQQDINIAFDDTQEGGGFDDFARAIEAKLREKNAQPSKPLTDEQIIEMYNEPRSDAEMLEFARAIEAAHGIKEKNT